jgi:hypothetical protein
MPYSPLTPQQASAILAAHLPRPPTGLPVVTPLQSTDADPEARSRFHSYVVHCAPYPVPYLVTFQLSEPIKGDTPLSVPNTLRAQYALQSVLHAHIVSTTTTTTTTTSGTPPLPVPPLPFPEPIALNVDGSFRPYILARIPAPFIQPSTPLQQLAAVRASLPTERVAFLELRLGVALRTLHNLQSEWCGPPTLESEGLYSWQEAFTLLIEESLSAAESAGLASADDVATLRSYLARAIGAFLFDDVEVPSLVALTAGAESVFITGVDGEMQLALLLPSFAHLLYGDPLLERAFSPFEAPSRALLEGYGEPPPIVFSRQRTKRMWYDLYLGLVVLLGARRAGGDQNVDWAVRLVEHSRVLLKDAPCY